MKYLLNKIIVVFIISLTIAHGQIKSTNLKSSKTQLAYNKVNSIEQALVIDIFSNIPNEIEGCSCLFSNNAKEFNGGKYIYANDFAQISFLKINGVLTKFIQTEYKNLDKYNSIAKAKSAKYEIIVKAKTVKAQGTETSIITGTILLSDKNGKSITKIFYGECGC